MVAERPTGERDYRVVATGGVRFTLGQCLGSGDNKMAYLLAQNPTSLVTNVPNHLVVIKFLKIEQLALAVPASVRKQYLTKVAMYQYDQLRAVIEVDSSIAVATCYNRATILKDGYGAWEYAMGTGLDKLLSQIVDSISERQEIETSPFRDLLYGLQHFFFLGAALDTPLDMKPDNFVVRVIDTADGKKLRQLVMIDLMEKTDYFRESHVKNALKLKDDEAVPDSGEPLTHLKKGLEWCSRGNVVVYKFLIETIEAAAKVQGPLQSLCVGALETFRAGDVYHGTQDAFGDVIAALGARLEAEAAALAAQGAKSAAATAGSAN